MTAAFGSDHQLQGEYSMIPQVGTPPDLHLAKRERNGIIHGEIRICAHFYLECQHNCVRSDVFVQIRARSLFTVTHSVDPSLSSPRKYSCVSISILHASIFVVRGENRYFDKLPRIARRLLGQE